MASSHKCRNLARKTYYLESRDGNIHALEIDALIVPSLTQDLIGGKDITNDLEFRVILDKDPNIAGIYP